MSYVRWGTDNSDVYLYESADGCVCCGCSIDLADPIGYTTRNLDDMLAHLRLHRKVGHVVPDWVDTALRERWPA